MYIFSAKWGFLIFKKVVYKTTFVISVLINGHLANEMCDRYVEMKTHSLKLTFLKFKNFTFCLQRVFIWLYGSQMKLGLFIYVWFYNREGKCLTVRFELKV